MRHAKQISINLNYNQVDLFSCHPKMKIIQFQSFTSHISDIKLIFKMNVESGSFNSLRLFMIFCFNDTMKNTGVFELPQFYLVIRYLSKVILSTSNSDHITITGFSCVTLKWKTNVSPLRQWFP